jgi:hypothetical protein
MNFHLLPMFYKKIIFNIFQQFLKNVMDVMDFEYCGYAEKK